MALNVCLTTWDASPLQPIRFAADRDSAHRDIDGNGRLRLWLLRRGSPQCRVQICRFVVDTAVLRILRSSLSFPVSGSTYRLHHNATVEAAASCTLEHRTVSLTTSKQMSPTDMFMPGIKGKRVPGRPGRFDPSEPLHMTTRRAAKTGTTNGSPSLNGSVDDNDSRRGSLDDSRPFTSHSNGSQFSAKSRALSDVEVGRGFSMDGDQMNGLNMDEENGVGEEVFEPLPSIGSSPSPSSPSRKRKRSSSPVRPSSPQQLSTPLEPSTPQQQSSPQHPPDSEQPSLSEHVGDVPAITVEQHDPLPDDDDMDTAEVIPPEDLSDRDVPPSQASSHSDDVAANGDTLMGPSLDATPAVSGHVSPVTSESNSEEGMTNAKHLGAALEAARAEQEEQEDADDNEDAMDVVEDLEDGEEVDGQVRSDDDGRPRRGRFGGRRRAKHAIPRVERAMQRQSELKSAYRAIARAQKVVLAEIAQRTIDGLEADPNAHLQAMEYDTVRDGLRASFDERRERIEAQHEFNMEQLQKTLSSQASLKKDSIKSRLDMMQDEQLDSLEYRVLEIARAAQRDGHDGGDETEDEDEVVLRPKGMSYRWKRTAALDQIYDSRSRQSLEMQRATADMHRRYEMRRMLDQLPQDERPEVFGGFTIRDNAAREVAAHKRNSRVNTQTLANAAAEIERLEAIERATRIPIIPNEEAIGLQVLSELASRPSLSAGSVPPQGQEMKGSDGYMGQTPTRSMPPHLKVQTNYSPSRIPVEMSPRTTQAMNNRFDPARGPPSTPRQDAKTDGRSPQANRSNAAAQGSPRRNGRMDMASLFDKSPEGRAESRGGPFPDLNRRHIASGSQEQLPRFGASPFRFGERKGTNPLLWREYPSEQRSVFERPEIRREEQPPFAFLSGGSKPPSMSQSKREDGMVSKTEPSSAQGFGYSRPFPWADLPSQAGGAEDRSREQTSPRHDPARRATIDTVGSPPARHGSTFSIRDPRDNDGKSKDFKTKFPHKTSKAERGGVPRRQWSRELKKPGGNSLPKPGPASAMSPPAKSPVFPSVSGERTAPPPLWQSSGPPLQSPLNQPQSVFGRAPSFGGAPHPFHTNFRDFHHSRDLYQPPHNPASIWNQPSPSPLYAIPQPPPNHPPPPGVPADQYNRFGPPQPPQSAPGSYGLRFGGPPIAPATPNLGFSGLGWRPSQGIPAFAQQAQQQQQQAQQQAQQQQGGSGGGLSGHRRRTQSDVSFPKFQPWQPPGSGGRR